MVRGVFNNVEWLVCSKQATKQSHGTYFVAKSEQGDCFADRQRFALSILNTPYSEARNDDVLCKRHALHQLYKNRR